MIAAVAHVGGWGRGPGRRGGLPAPEPARADKPPVAPGGGTRLTASTLTLLRPASSDRNSMNGRARTAISAQGWHYLLLLAFIFAWAIVREGNLLLIVAGMLCGPLLCSWWLARRTLRDLDVRRKMPRAVYAGEPLVVEIELRNRRKRLGCWAVRVEDHLRPEDEPQRDESAKPTVLFSYVRAGELQRRAYRGRFAQRGRYRFGPLKVSTRFPFGLLRRTITLKRAQTLTVYPRLGRLAPAWVVENQEAFQGARGGGRAGRAAGDFCGVREWQAGDSVRRVHWRSTARHGAVVVCQFERPRRHDLALLVDLWQPDQPDQEDLENVERAVSFAATLVADACRRGGRHVVLGITGREPDCIAGPTSTPLLEHALERLAVAKASQEDRLPALLELAAKEITPGTEVLLVSTRARDAHRLAALWADPHRDRRASRVRVLRPADPEFSNYFRTQ